MAGEESALLRLWREGEFEPEDISVNLIVQLGPHKRFPERQWPRIQHACRLPSRRSNAPINR